MSSPFQFSQLFFRHGQPSSLGDLGRPYVIYEGVEEMGLLAFLLQFASPGRVHHGKLRPVDVDEFICVVGTSRPPLHFVLAGISLESAPRSSIKDRIDSTRQAVVLGPSFTDGGNRPEATPAHHPLLLIGMISRTVLSRTNPVAGRTGGWGSTLLLGSLGEEDINGTSFWGRYGKRRI